MQQLLSCDSLPPKKYNRWRRFTRISSELSSSNLVVMKNCVRNAFPLVHSVLIACGVSIGMNKISQDERVVIGLNGNLYFSNLMVNDSRNYYMCNAQYLAARTLLQETTVTLNVLHSKSN